VFAPEKPRFSILWVELSTTGGTVVPIEVLLKKGIKGIG
jgi:hypothetical protein